MGNLWPLVVWVFLMCTPTAVTTQTVHVRVVDEQKTALPNAEIIDRVNGTRRFTNATGEALVPRGDNELHLRVRQLGFQFIDRTVPMHLDTVTFELKRVAYALPTLRTTTTSACLSDGDPRAALLSAAVLEQLRASAERYEEFRRVYPFRVRLERISGNIMSTGDVRPTRASQETETSDRWGERYVPDQIIKRTGVGFSVPILFIAALADPVFWERHCFSAHGFEWFDTTRVIRLTFAPKPSVRTPDWEGAALVDSATSMLRRVEFRLTGLKARDRPRRLEGYTTFMSPSPFIAVPDTTTAIWWRRDVPDSLWGRADAVQRIALKEITFLKNTPPAFQGRQR